MRAQIDVLREVLVEWLQMHEQDYDFWLFTKEEWAERMGEDRLLHGAELVFGYENNLWDSFPNYEDEFIDLAEGFGYYFERWLDLGWWVGFYPLEDWPSLPPENAPYSKKLKDERWQSKRKRILQRSQDRCEECGRSDQPLEVHHCYYRYGRQVWQYPDGSLLALCRGCHEKRQDVELRFRLFLPTVRTKEMETIQRVLRHCQYWFDRQAFNDFLTTLENVPGGISIGGPDGQELTAEQFEQRQFNAEYQALREKLYRMLATHGHPDERGDEWPRNCL